jgi:hypothetical protein
VSIAKLPELFPRSAGPDMRYPGTTERKYPHIVELAVGEDALDVGLGRRIMHFHSSRHIKPRYGHIILSEGKTYYRRRFLDLPTARAFIEQFGGSLHEPSMG